jgi:mannose-6-phosphate isomerase-like protein (cupin superfamily)
MTERLQVGHDELTIHATGDVFAVDVQMPAGGGPPMLHRHVSAEVYRVIDGEFAIYRATGSGEIERVVAGPGSVVAVPGGTEHTVRNESPAAAQAYVVFAPGDPAERFVRAAAALSADGPPELGAVLAAAQRNGVEITRPIPS